MSHNFAPFRSESLVEEEAGGEENKQHTESSVTITALKHEPVLVEEVSDTESELPDVEDKVCLVIDIFSLLQRFSGCSS